MFDYLSGDEDLSVMRLSVASYTYAENDIKPIMQSLWCGLCFWLDLAYLKLLTKDCFSVGRALVYVGEMFTTRTV